MFRRIIAGVLINSLALYATVYLLDSISYSGGIKFFIWGGVIIGFINSLVKPLLKILALPLVVLTAGLFVLVINAFSFWLFVKTVQFIDLTGVAIIVNSSWTYLWASLIFGAVNYLLYLIFKKI